jgi:hypothetical protein
MFIDTPASFQEALDAAAVKSLLPTSGRTRDLRRLESDIKRRALWSATVESVKTLLAIKTGVDAILAGTADQATVALDLLNVVQDQGYQPDPELAGGLQDVSSFPRRTLIIETQVAIARGAGWREQGMQADVLDEFPAMELFRAISPQGGAEAERKWAQIWADEGGLFFDGRMIALKTDDIWRRIADPAKYPDGLGNDFAPFRINSGMRTRDIDRDETEALGLITPATQLTPDPIDLSADLAATPALREEWVRQAITDSGLGTFDASGVLRFNQEDAA